MGANTFFTTGYGKTARDAFSSAKYDAQSEARADYEDEYGDGYEGGYSGTIAEKNGFVMIDLPAGEKPVEYANKLIDAGDRRIDDKWGPAGCIHIKDDKYLFFGWASC